MRDKVQLHAHDAAPSCDDVAPYLIAAALGDQDPATRDLVTAHLQTCAACQTTFATAHQTADGLLLAVPDARPAPDLRARVIGAVEAAAQGAPARRRAMAWRWRWPFNVTTVWRVASAALLVALLSWNIVVQHQFNTHVVTQQHQQALLAEVLQAPEVARIGLAADPPARTARGTVVLVPERQMVALAVEHLPPLPAGHVYQLWLINNDQRTSGGTFTVDTTGRGLLIAHTPRPLNTFTAVGVTVEPHGGSVAPTTPRVIGGPLS